MSNVKSLLILCCVGIGCGVAQTPSPTGIAQSPDQIALTFYRWYLHEIDEGHIPLVHSPKQIREYVSATLRESLMSKKGLQSQGADYFLKAQDTLEDWASHVTASSPKLTGDSAQTVVTLGATPESRHHLRVSLVKEAGSWKIQRVDPVPKGR